MIKYLVAALCLLVPVAALGQGSRTPSDKWPHYNVANLPSTCVADTDMVVVDDSTTVGGCSVGGGAEPGICICNSTGTGFEPTTAGTGVAASEPHDCDATVLGTRYYNTVRNEVLTCRDVTPIAEGTSPPDVYEWSVATDQVLDVRDFGAVCNFRSGDLTSTLNDDGPAINQAIEAASPSGQTARWPRSVYIPGHCYTEEQIEWRPGVNVFGDGRRASGIFCAPGMNDDCVVTFGGNHGSTVMSHIRIGKARPCVEDGTRMGGIFASTTTCTKAATTDTKGSGIRYTWDTADGKNLEDIWVDGFPEYGVWVDQGTDGFWADELVLGGNGVWPGESGTAESGTATTLTDTDNSGVWTTDQWKGYFVRIIESGEKRTRLVTTSSSTGVLTFSALDAVDAFSITASSTYTIDRGGGIIVEADVTLGGSEAEEQVGCRVSNITGDGNEPAMVQLYNNAASNGTSCTFVNIDHEGSATATYAVDIISPANIWRFSGINFRGANSIAAIYMEGQGLPQNVFYDALNIKESDVDYFIDTSGMDKPTSRIQIADRTYTGNFMLRASTGVWNSGPVIIDNPTDTPYACALEFNGHQYYDANNGPCFCDGTAALWCPIAAGPGCNASTDCGTP